jgi:SAM-dependent methyltransferase
MEIKKPIPPSRNVEQVYKQYLVEKEIAEKLKAASREERKRIYATMYDELFAKVPDHPRLTRRTSEERTRRVNVDKLSLVERFLRDTDVFLEFAPGDCRFSFAVAKRVKRVIAVDVSDQRNPEDPIPENFELIVYDGYDLSAVESDSVDIVFSDQLIEHFHPEDTRLHFELILRILKPGGKYVFRTPSAVTGPHDISAYFSDKPEGLHLKEWTYGEILEMVRDVGYSKLYAYWHKRRISVRLPLFCHLGCEKVLRLFPKRIARRLARIFMPYVYAVAIK